MCDGCDGFRHGNPSKVTDRPSQNDGFVTDALFFWSTVSEVSTVSTETYMYTKSVSCQATHERQEK